MSDSQTRSRWIGVVVPVVLGLVVLLLLFPSHGVDTDPPQCWSVFGNPSPCGRWVGLGAGVVAGAIGWFALGGGRRGSS